MVFITKILLVAPRKRRRLVDATPTERRVP
jgi:hypothetical protein